VTINKEIKEKEMKHLLVNQFVKSSNFEDGEGIMPTYLCNSTILNYKKDKVTTDRRKVTCKNCLRILYLQKTEVEKQ